MGAAVTEERSSTSPNPLTVRWVSQLNCAIRGGISPAESVTAPPTKWANLSMTRIGGFLLGYQQRESLRQETVKLTDHSSTFTEYFPCVIIKMKTHYSFINQKIIQ